MNTLILGLSLLIQFLVFADMMTSITGYSTTGTFPSVGALTLLIMLCTDSDPGDYRVGSKPKAHPATAERRHVAAMG